MRSFVALVAIAAGCGDHGASAPLDAADAAGPRVVAVYWTLKTAAGAVQPCPTGFDTARVSVGGPRGDGYAHDYPCSAGVGMMTDGSTAREGWGAGVTIMNVATGGVFGVSNSVPIAGAAAVDVTVITDLGRLGLSWTISRSGAPSTCADVGISTVALTVTPASGPVWTENAACTSSPVFTGDLPTGPASVAIQAGSASGSASANVPSGEQIANAPSIDLAF